MRKAWSEAETSVLLDAYFAMLNLELKGSSYSKIGHNRTVQQQTGRSKGSIEFKFCNVSHVLAEAGHAYINGYKPRSHVQESLRSASLAYISAEVSSRDAGPPTRRQSSVPLIVSKSSNGQDRVPPIIERASTVEKTLLPDSHSLWSFVTNMWDRATGGTDVAARPDHAIDDVWPVASRPPGVEEAITWLRDESNAASIPRFLFLVGGPGAGKSHATARAIHGLDLDREVDDGLANRIYQFHGPSRDLTVVNDATISGDNDTAPLAADIDLVMTNNEGTQHKTDFMACVNRGILIEEISALNKSSTECLAGEAVIRWLSDGTIHQDSSGWEITPKSDKRFVRSAWLRKYNDLEAYVVAVFVDECSLFEVRPDTKIAHDASIEATKYSIHSITDRPKIVDSTMPAGDLLMSIVKTITAAQSPSNDHNPNIVDPIAANLETLSSPTARSSFLTIARSSELMNSSRMTFRELWGLFSRAFVGNAPSTMTRDKLIDFILENQPTGMDALLDFQRLRKLSELRINQGIFGAGEEILPGVDSSRDPVLRYTVKVDPIRDALPGRLPHDVNSGWTTPISDAFAAHSSEGTPLELLLRSAPDEQFKSVVTAFDKRVDQAYKNALEEKQIKDTDRIALISWYSAYLHRLYALAYGIFAFRKEIATLVQIHKQIPHLPDHIQLPMQTLLRPRRNPDDAINESLLPLFDSRTDPITGRQSEPKLAVRVDPLDLKTVATQGEQTTLTFQKGSQSMGRMTLDFALVREALACVADRAGVTNLVDIAAPRLERIRASRLLSKRLSDAEIRIVDGQSGHQISQKTGADS
ncbi:hypothetical protein ACX80D_17000 [Arthrobacter sp. Sr24]